MLYHGEISACWEIKKKHPTPQPSLFGIFEKKKEKIFLEKKKFKQPLERIFLAHFFERKKWILKSWETSELLLVYTSWLQNLSWYTLSDQKLWKNF